MAIEEGRTVNRKPVQIYSARLAGSSRPSKRPRAMAAIIQTGEESVQCQRAGAAPAFRGSGACPGWDSGPFAASLESYAQLAGVESKPDRSISPLKATFRFSIASGLRR